MHSHPENPPAPPAPPLVPVFLVAGTALGYEVLLMRLFSITQWHHFAYMVISLALLGYGVSGTFLTLAGRWLIDRFAGAFAVNAALFGLSATACFLIAQQIPFNALEIAWDSRQWGLLLLAYLLLFVPFFFAANCICLSFLRFPQHIARIYSFDLLGSGTGALAIILVLYLVHPVTALLLISATGLLAAALSLFQAAATARTRWLALIPAGLVAMLFLLPDTWTALRLSDYKTLVQALRIPETAVIHEVSGPLGLVSVIDSPKVPFRHAPGLSLNSRSGPPPQLGMIVDGDALAAINRYDGSNEPLTYLDYLTSAAPYHVNTPADVLVLGLGGGTGVLQAVYHGVSKIEAVEINPQSAALLTGVLADYSGWHHLRDRVRVELGEARRFVEASEHHYDLITLTLLDAAGAASGGIYGLNESYLYTTEALEAYLDRLRPGGLVAITRWLHLPPRDGLKLFATAVNVLRGKGLDPSQHLMMIRSWKTSTLIISPTGFDTRATNALKDFARERSFDTVYYPGMPAAEANVYNRLSEPYFYQGAKALLGPGADQYIRDYKFHIAPATDDRPYFYNFFKWSTLPEILSLKERGGISLLELGYPVMLITLVQAVLASLLLILLPLALSRTRLLSAGPAYLARVAGYFGAIGLGYIFIEIAFIQKLILFLGHPIYAVAVALAGFLVFSGLGSRYAGRFAPGYQRGRLLLIAVFLTGTAVLYLWLLPFLFTPLATLADGWRILLALATIAPLGFFMGMPFPLGLNAVSQHAPELVPWAWGINGCTSLISAILATVLAIHLGFVLVVLIAVGLYLTAVSLRIG